MPAQFMLPPPAKQQEQLLQWLDGMPPADHEMFLGNWLYLLIQVHHAYLLSPYTRHPGPPALHRDAHRACMLQAVDPAVRVGKVTGMLLDQDVGEIVPLFFFPKMVRSTSPSSSLAVACTRPTCPVARGATATG
eukprot:scaffold39131_cov40-Phaeocystis_antarctica.AAC.1